MAELAFPLAALGLTFLVLVPALTALSRLALARARRRTASWVDFGSARIYALIVSPTLLPVAWLTSSALHQSEPWRRAQACLLEHVTAHACLDAVLLLGALLLGGLGAVVWRGRTGPVEVDSLSADHPLAARVARLSAKDPQLAPLDVVVARRAGGPVFTVGRLSPKVVLDACFVEQADDEVVRAALLHERAHIDGQDNLRGFVARLCLAVNPAGRLLAADLRRYGSAREAGCDAEAVARGGAALALAEGIVRAAKFRCAGGPAGASALCGHDPRALKLRLALLMRGPDAPARSAGHLALFVGAAAVVLAPHLPGGAALDVLHLAVERWLHALV